MRRPSLRAVDLGNRCHSGERTRLELEHRHIDRHGPGWQAVTAGVDGDEGWPLYLARYAALFTEGS